MTTSRGRRADTAAAIMARDLARTVRDACLDAALEAYETAGLGGLCAEGRWEAAVDAIRSVDPEAILAAVARAQEARPATAGTGDTGLSAGGEPTPCP